MLKSNWVRRLIASLQKINRFPSGMGTEIEGKGYGYYSMRNVNNNWPILYGEKSLPSNGEDYAFNGFSHRNVMGFDKNTLRKTMLEHEAIFKSQVVELHCLYKTQRDMMDEVRRKDLHKHGVMMMMMIPGEASSSSSPSPSPSPFSAWNSPLSSLAGSKDCEMLDHRPSKVRKRLFDLQVNANEEGECSYDALDYHSKKEYVFLADLNEPSMAEETESNSCQIEAKSKSGFLDRVSKEAWNGRRNWSSYPAIKTLGFLQTEQRKEFHGKKLDPFGIINHKMDWSQSWGMSIQNPTSSCLYSARDMTSSQLGGHNQETLGGKSCVQPAPTSNLCFWSPLANHNHNGFYGGSLERKQDQNKHLPSWLKPNSEFKPDSAEPRNSTPPGKIPGFAMTDYPPMSKEEESSPLQNEGKTRELIDINVAYYDPESEENKTKTKTHIDLNSCITEDEDPPVNTVKRSFLGTKIPMEIDLEAPPQPEEDEDDNVKNAAETIILISVTDCPNEENSLEDPLGWFAEIAVPCNSLCEEIVDYFEAVTLSLPEMKQEEYMPTELTIPNNSGEEGGGVVAINNGRSRRGRQRRDFQMDILPGLISLSRNEVSEDIQKFTGLMKATGHTWQSPRRVSGRKRRPTVEPDPPPPPAEELTAVQSFPIEQGIYEDMGSGRSLSTIWGKTIRRPRRQRCPAVVNLNTTTTSITANKSIISS